MWLNTHSCLAGEAEDEYAGIQEDMPLRMHIKLHKLSTKTHPVTGDTSGHAAVSIQAVYLVTLYPECVMVASIVPRRHHQDLSILINSSASPSKLNRLAAVKTEHNVNAGQEGRRGSSQLSATATVTCPGSSFVLCSSSTSPEFYFHLKQKEGLWTDVAVFLVWDWTAACTSA